MLINIRIGLFCFNDYIDCCCGVSIFARKVEKVGLLAWKEPPLLMRKWWTRKTLEVSITLHKSCATLETFWLLSFIALSYRMMGRLLLCLHEVPQQFCHLPVLWIISGNFMVKSFIVFKRRKVGWVGLNLIEIYESSHLILSWWFLTQWWKDLINLMTSLLMATLIVVYKIQLYKI